MLRRRDQTVRSLRVEHYSSAVNIYLKAKAEPDFRFYLLYDKVYREDILFHAYRLARSNEGAPGVDGQSFEEIEAMGLEGWLSGIRDDLRAKTYRPEPVRRAMVPKPGGGERPLGIPMIRDRVVQGAVALRAMPSRRSTSFSVAATRTWLTRICPSTSIRFPMRN